MDILKIVRALESTPIEIITHDMNCEFTTAVSEAASLLVSQGERIAELEEQNRWIPVTERLPTPYVDVITCRRDFLARGTTIGKEYITIRDNEIPSWSQDYQTWKSKVTHWMPLPEPPKEVG